MITSAEKMRAWTGPAILSFGFRPFFLLGAVWAALAMLKGQHFCWLRGVIWPNTTSNRRRTPDQ